MLQPDPTDDLSRCPPSLPGGAAPILATTLAGPAAVPPRREVPGRIGETAVLLTIDELDARQVRLFVRVLGSDLPSARTAVVLGVLGSLPERLGKAEAAAFVAWAGFQGDGSRG